MKTKVVSQTLLFNIISDLKKDIFKVKIGHSKLCGFFSTNFTKYHQIHADGSCICRHYQSAPDWSEQDILFLNLHRKNYQTIQEGKAGEKNLPVNVLCEYDEISN